MKRHVTRRRVSIALAVILLLLWWLWPNGQLARVQALQKELAQAGSDMTPERRRELGQQMRAAMDQLSPSERARLRGDFQKQMEERMAKYFAMSPQEKQKHLDQQIDQMQSFAQGKAKGGGGPGGPPGGSAKSADDKEKRRQQRLDSTSPEFRAQMDQYRKEMDQRRQQRGLPPSSGRGGR